jgi:fructan beta-fructosidase
MRPKYHFTSQNNWLNDPNGLCFLEGEYHLFFQHNPSGDTPGNIGWGHAVSTNLLEWQQLPMALPFDGEIMAFSGSVVIDHANTSGFGKAAMVAVYTAHHTNKRLETQHLAYSLDRGRTWVQYAGNPVLDIGYADFRDPKVFWHNPSQRWVMVIALPNQRQVQFYGSDNLTQWQHLSTFGPSGQTGGIWEVPDLLELPFEAQSRWVLKVDVGSQAQFGGSGGQYFVGHFDGAVFTAENNHWLDYGRDFYAALSFANTQRPLWLAWMNNWDYAKETPTHPWRGCMSLPRALGLKRSTDGIRLTQMPIAELRTMHQEAYELQNTSLENQRLDVPLAGAQLEIKLEAMVFGELIVRLAKSGDHYTEIGYNAQTQELFIDRRRSGDVNFHPDFSGRHFASMPLEGENLRLVVILDTCTLEVFAGDGEIVLSDLIFPFPEAQNLELEARGQVQIKQLDVWRQ